MPNLLGTAPNQVPTNADLGKLAFMDVVDTVTNNPYLDTAISDTKPSLLLDFANSKTLDPRITYTRASTASYYDGKTTAMAEQNLLSYSQDFDNSVWVKPNVTITANSITAPDGTSTADTILCSSGSAAHYVENVTTFSTLTAQTVSVYLKSGTSNFASLMVSGANSSRWLAVTVNLSTGVITQSSNGVNATLSGTTISPLANGWYRVSVTGTFSALDPSIVWVQVNSTGTPTYGNFGLETWTAAGTETVYAWGAQLEQRSSVTAYTPTTSSAITNYIPALQTAAAGVPRFDHDPVTGESKGFLIEEQRTNLLTYSDDFANAAWTKDGTTVAANALVAPDGTLTGDIIVENSAASVVHRFYRNPTVAANTSVAASFYIKQVYGNRNVLLRMQLTTDYFDVTINPSTGVIVSSNRSGTATTPTITVQAVGNGWYKVSASGIVSTTSANPYFIVELVTGTTETYTGDGWSGVGFWGAQLEAGSFATSYIPTTSAQVTRSADSASITGANFSSWFRNSEGTFYGESGVINNRLVCAYNTSSGARLADLYNNGTAFQFYSSNGSNFTFGAYSNNSKVAGAYSPSSYSAALNGAIGGTSIPTMPLTSVDTLGIGNYTGSAFANGTIKKLAYYPKRLSDAELQEMTL